MTLRTYTLKCTREWQQEAVPELHSTSKSGNSYYGSVRGWWIEITVFNLARFNFDISNRKTKNYAVVCKSNHFVNSELAFVITVVNLKTAILTQRKKNQIRFTLYCFYIIIYLSKNPVISSGDDFDQCSWCARDQN